MFVFFFFDFVSLNFQLKIKKLCRSWFLTGLFGGVRRDLTSSTVSMSSQIEEADEIVEAKPTTVPQKQQQQQNQKFIEIKPVEQNKGKESLSNIKAKPTMLREMNFWAPTSY